MEAALLEQKGLSPRVVGPAKLTGYALKIGERATLVRDAEEATYGMLIDLADAEASRLYSEPGVADYRAESVRVRLLNDQSAHAALCYNLPATASGTPVNVSYARQLAQLSRQLGFPDEYSDKIYSR